MDMLHNLWSTSQSVYCVPGLKKYLALKTTCLFDIKVQLGRHPVYCLQGLQIKEIVTWVISKEPCVLRPPFWVSPSITRNREGGDRKWDPVP